MTDFDNYALNTVLGCDEEVLEVMKTKINRTIERMKDNASN